MFVTKLRHLLNPGVVSSLIQHRAMSGVAGPKMHEMIAPLSWLLGKWRSEGGKGIYPTIKDFTYGEEVEFFHVGQPNIQFTCCSWKSESKAPLHREAGFIRIKPDTNKVAMMIAQNTGICEIEEGEVTGQKMETTSQSVARMSFSKPPKTLKVSRTFKRDGDTLEQVLYMETENTPYTEHLRIKYTKV
ncbi:peroxynitrite isomerase THAP4-like isoform X2 [Gigantopelta aegis]|uniref:peroxynitrite isomerase THAP4-like isoform X2 n=2 Tax=Gigantopelta aegis TaxID=1735272 RepID=UPI001B88B054|nr:peroxynitrite isomerase THAP4-like isoform X2 [Gigantopelta aegis]